MYRVLDTENKLVGNFETYSDANHFRHLQGRPDWTIKQVPKRFFTSSSTERQRRAVRYCEKWLNIKFAGDINHFQACSDFLSHYLDLAKATQEQQEIEYPDWLINDLRGDYDDAMG